MSTASAQGGRRRSAAPSAPLRADPESLVAAAVAARQDLIAAAVAAHDYLAEVELEVKAHLQQAARLRRQAFRAAVAGGVSQSELARQLGVSTSAVNAQIKHEDS